MGTAMARPYLLYAVGDKTKAGRPASPLVSRVRIEIDFDDVTLIRNVCRVYHTS